MIVGTYLFITHSLLFLHTHGIACQHSAFIVANSLADKTRQRWKWVTNQSIALSAVLCLVLGICGYLGFLGTTQGKYGTEELLCHGRTRVLLCVNIYLMLNTSLFFAGDVLNNFPLDSLQANAARILLAFSKCRLGIILSIIYCYEQKNLCLTNITLPTIKTAMFFTYPMESFVARHVLIMLVHNGDMDAKGGFTLENESRVEEEELGDDEATVHTTATTGSIIEGGGVICMNRRQTWTVMVYLVRTHLLPKLLVETIKAY